MTRPSRVFIDKDALTHNVSRVKQVAPSQKIIAMVKANAYGCGLINVLPVFENHVDAYGVACLEEALAVRAFGGMKPCVLFQGVFSPDEWLEAAKQGFQIVIHQHQQLRWLLAHPLPKPVFIWIKVDTGMHRLGFHPSEVLDVMSALHACAWVDKTLGLMSHFATADEPNHVCNDKQWTEFTRIQPANIPVFRSMANSAAILSNPATHCDWVRPGIMLYGASPFADKTADELGLKPVMYFHSAITAIRALSAGEAVGYGGTWISTRPTRLGLIPVGYGDGYPRHIAKNTLIWVNGQYAPIVGRVSMDMLTVDLTDCSVVHAGDNVELWGAHVAIDDVARSAGTIAYELLCQVTNRVR